MRIVYWSRRSTAVSIRNTAHDGSVITPWRGPKGSTGKRAVVEVGFHSLRHTFVSLCRAANAPLSVVESIVGHSNPAMTRHYTHTSEAAAGAAVAALPDITEQATVTPVLPAADPDAILKVKIRQLAEKLTMQNVMTIRKQLLSLAGAN